MQADFQLDILTTFQLEFETATKLVVALLWSVCDIGLLRRHDAPGVGPWGGWCVAEDLDEAAQISMEAGMDIELCQPTDMRGLAFNRTADLVRNKRMDVKHLDRATANLLRAK